MTHNYEQPEADSNQQNARQAGRRQLLKRSALLVPAIVTLHARPAFAQTDGTYGYNSYLIVDGQIQEVTGSWHTQQEAQNNTTIQNTPDP